ncbi:phosphodiester glycosidase family protein [Rhizobium sp. 9T]|uniref:phosphodiester glycosidase family protein n=1 Tax=Rhizobium croatiense TaxID=2867516 RepID=UPI001C933CFD|nr:phosphodiester glycosidase family protein [Rhizobium croatiense]MBY4606509.1 phosphodiester glycosidase family protein [Rhizobium croatiense]
MTYLKHGMLALAFVLAALLPLHHAQAEQCEKVTFDEAQYVVCSLEVRKVDLRLFWKGADGEPYRAFSSLAEAVRAEGRKLTFAVNAGMYRADFSPMGLYVENGRELKPANMAAAQSAAGQVPNFYKKPNGVFFLGEAGAGILPTDVFLKLAPKARFATQSGPMLVIANRLNPIFIIGSTDRTRRSGVGVCENGIVRFAISEDGVNFHDFARLFRDRLQCPDALFLDGGRGAGLYNPEMGRNDWSWHGGYGPIFGLVE